MIPAILREGKEIAPMQPTIIDPVTHYVCLEGSANALATNKEASQVVVAGRNVFKIFNVEANKFVEKLNLRIGKNVDLSYSCADVVWNPVDNAVLATAATNGSVVTWNLNSLQKQDMKFQDHKRTVNKVCFHTTEAQLLLSGSQDGTMKLFDLRKKEVSSTFYSLSESVRDVQFCPHQYFSFAAVQENGYVQLWDLRRTDRFERQFAAHSGPVFTCDWHPDEKLWLATAGRDKTIKVWDISHKESLQYCIQTIASVSRVKWRPNKKYHIGSSSLVVDFTVNVWDVRRPFVPLASFCKHKDVVTGFAWRSPKLLLTTSKDCKLFQHSFTDADKPADRANPVGLNIDPWGDIGYAFNKNNLKETTISVKGYPNFSVSKILPSGRKSSSAHDRYKTCLSALVILEDQKQQVMSMKWFVETAKRYLLHGKPLPDLCEHNANVASQLNRPHISQTWLILKLLYTSGSMLLTEYSHVASQDDKALESSLESSQKPRVNNGVPYRSHPNSSKPVSRHVSGGSHATIERGINDNLEDDSDSGNTEHENTITYIASELTQGDFFFGDGEAELFRMLDYSQFSTLPADEDWTLPREAFNVRHRLGDGSPPPEVANMPNSPLCAAEEISEREFSMNEEEEQSMMLALFNAPRFPPWNFTDIVVDMLQFYAEQGDVQMAVSVLIVLGEKLKYIVKESLQEQWFQSYLELLSRFKLWNISNEVIALSSLPAINSLNQQSTIVNSICGKCGKFMNSVGWYCDNCKETNVCSVCHQLVRGIFVWCQGCAHGGHLLHIQEWFQKNKKCPVGCGHLCEYT
ncbi:GATOR2 complex protein WDR24 isoform X2 [Parasteatoda tepidariorum]|uniref:GATOR2 complex protein WDR24 isoform X2 n=1 Tax=Parasteatoda tepidariorum TaxID=114398 RepID=UPI00077FB546|nr:GATOR complex protein WDR24 isoform X2 [Parasteatoda tepidariorum]